MSGRYRVLVDFDIALEKIFGAPPLKSTVGMLKETVEKQPQLVKALRGAYGDAMQMIKIRPRRGFLQIQSQRVLQPQHPGRNHRRHEGQ